MNPSFHLESVCSREVVPNRDNRTNSGTRPVASGPFLYRQWSVFRLESMNGGRAGTLVFYVSLTVTLASMFVFHTEDTVEFFTCSNPL